jgi:hypothetical protein
METIFTCCAALAGSLFLGVFALSLTRQVEADPDHVTSDIDLPVTDAPELPEAATMSGMWFGGMFTLRAILAGVSVFGLSGLAMANQLSERGCVVSAASCGLCTMYVMGTFIRAMHRVEHDEIVRLQNTLGTEGTVSLTVPARNSGLGKVTLAINGRKSKYAARTSHYALSVGSAVLVVGIEPPDTVDVRACDIEPERA